MGGESMRRGIKRSSRLIFRRRLLLVRLLLRAPASGPELIEAAQRELGEQGYPAAAASALKHDLDALKSEYGCRITFQRDEQRYVLEDLGELSLLDLPDECLEALAFLETSFPSGAIPEHTHISTLLDRVLMLFPRRRQLEHRSQRAAIQLKIPGSASTSADRAVLAAVKRAIRSRQELCFDYIGINDDQPRRHRVAPYQIFFRPEGHAYLDATLLEARPPGPEPVRAAIDYRLDRIVPGSLEVLPQVLPPQRPRPPSYVLRYWLAPVVARRRDISTYFPDSAVTYHADGSATVEATISNLWQARQILLRYGPECRVLDPPELIALFREAARGLAELYG